VPGLDFSTAPESRVARGRISHCAVKDTLSTLGLLGSAMVECSKAEPN
jgi:hypothetical protein